MLNRKTIFTLTFSLVTGLVLVGCGTQATPEPAAAQAPATESALQELSTETVELPPTDAPTEAPTEAPSEVPAPAGTVSFANDVMPIIQSRCVNCHGGDRIEEGLLMRTYAEIMAGSENGLVIVPGDIANSLLVELITSKEMPKKGPKLTPPQIQIITDWVAAGAPNN